MYILVLNLPLFKSMKKYTISVGAGLAILFLAYLLSNLILGLEKNEISSVSEVSKLVIVKEVKNSVSPINLSVDGRIKSKNKIDIYSEVQGVVNLNGNTFKEGKTFKKNEIILSIKSDEFSTSVKQARSELQNLIASILPDIKIDFNENFNSWNDYFQKFNVENEVPELPTSKSDKEKYYLVGKGIQSMFYKVKSLEERLKKFVIYAPFDGSISKTYMTEGTLINPGMILGSFISNSDFELTVNIPSKYADFVLINNEINITVNDKIFKGLIKRTNKNIDELSQTVSVHIEFMNKNLKDGMYVNTKIPLNLDSKGFPVSRSILINDSFVYVAENNNLVGIRNVKPIYYDEDSVIISGLKDGEKIISSYIPGIYKGMKIKISD